MAAIQFKHIHSSSRFDRALGVFEDAVHAYEAAADLVTYTEMTDDSRNAVFDDPGWEYYHPSNADCSVEWKTSKFTQVGDGEIIAITDMTFTRSAEYGGNVAPPTKVVKVTLQSVETGQKICVLVTHMPLENTALRREIWIDCCRGLVSLIKNVRQNNPGIKILVAADWNRNWRQDEDRRLMQTHMAGPVNITQAWDGFAPAHGGTHGPISLLDGDMSDLPILDCYLFADDDSSDHRPYLVRYGIGEGSPVPAYESKTQQEIQRLINILDRPGTDDDLLKIFSFNVKRDHSAAQVIADIKKGLRKTNADLVGLQEAWQYIEEIEADTEITDEFRVLAPGYGGNIRIAAVTVLARKKSFSNVNATAFLGANAAGDQPSRQCIKMTGTHRGSGQSIIYINTHMNAGVQPLGSNTSDPATAEYEDHMNRILAEIEAAPEDTPFFISADWNVSWPNQKPVVFWPMKALGRNGFVANWSYDRSNNPATTFKGGGSLFDQVYHRRMASVRFKGDLLVPNDHSDHFGVMSAYGLLKVIGDQSDS